MAIQASILAPCRGRTDRERTVAHSALRLGGEDAVNKEVAIAADHYHHNHDHHVKHYILQPYSFGPGSIPVTGPLKLFFRGRRKLHVAPVITFMFAVAVGLSIGVGSLMFSYLPTRQKYDDIGILWIILSWQAYRW